MIDHLAYLTSDKKEQIIYALLDWYDGGTFDVEGLWRMPVEELKELHAYESMLAQLDGDPNG